MKPEPLDGKRKTIFGERIRLGVNEGVIFNNFPFIELDYFVFDDVKFAVLGLKGDIQRYIDQYERAIDLAEKKGLDELELRLEKEVAGLRFALRRIDKWFKDVIE